jgi:carotenoid cleavage dioxygenase
MGFDNRAPVTAEHDYPALTITGEIPAGLRGMLFRNGPNPLQPAPEAHWFIGDGMVHAFAIGPHGVSYRNRWVRTQRWADAHGQSVANRPGGVANTNILAHAGHLLALEEAHLPVAMDAATLATIGAQDFGGALPEGPFTAHPKHDPRTGALVFFSYGATDLSDRIQVGELAADGTLIRLGQTHAPYAAMIHDFAVTEHFVAIPLFPLIGYTWRPEQGSWLGVMEREKGIESLRWHRAGPGFAFHTLNAWEAEGSLMIDLMLSDAPPFFPGADGVVPLSSEARLCRWTLDVADPDAAVTSRRLSDTGGEFPRIDERFAGRRNRHGYFSTFDALCHRDDLTGEERFFRMPPGDSVSEPVFAPRGAAEGDGWLLAVVFRGATCTSELVVLDAADIEAGLVALAHVPVRVPAGFHGNFVGDVS